MWVLTDVVVLVLRNLLIDTELHGWFLQLRHSSTKGQSSLVQYVPHKTR